MTRIGFVFKKTSTKVKHHFFREVFPAVCSEKKDAHPDENKLTAREPNLNPEVR